MTTSNWIRAGTGLINLAGIRKLDHRPAEGDEEFEVVADDEVIWQGSQEGAEHIINQLAKQLGATDPEALLDVKDR